MPAPPESPAASSPMLVGIPREIHPGEERVAATPTTVAALRKLGLDVVVQAGAGSGGLFSDADYVGAGARIAPDAQSAWSEADLVLKVRAPMELPEGGGHEVDLLKPGAKLVSFIWPAQSHELLRRFSARGATVLAMDCVPRITRAQSMDALSAMANVAGYRAVVEAAARYQGFFPGQATAAGRVPPARVLVIGAGVAGLAAVATAKSLGAVVSAFDTRPTVREQVESLGARFLELQFEESGEGEGGYAKEMSPAFVAAEQALIAAEAERSDVILSTALVPGKAAPQLITSGAVVAMSSGSVIVDLAAEQGGNCALTEPGRVVEKFGVTIVGLTDLTSRAARRASELYATTVLNLLADIVRPDRGWSLDLEDEVHRGVLVVHDGKITWPPPTRPKPRAGAPAVTVPKAAPAPPPQPTTTPAAWAVLGVLAVALGAAGLLGPPELLQHLTVFLLSCVIGWHLVWAVTPSLHTPLMSVTNAISGIILIGGMVVIGAGATGIVLVLATLAVLVAAVNVSGGFLVTQRMLRMFRR